MTGPANIVQWLSLAAKYAARHPILNAEEILAIVWNESSGDPGAVNTGDTSFGLMQVEIPVARQYGMFIGVPPGSENTDLLLVPDNNMRVGSAFLSYLKTRYFRQFPITWTNRAWVAAYNEGETNLLNGLGDPVYISRYIQHLKALGGTPA